MVSPQIVVIGDQVNINVSGASCHCVKQKAQDGNDQQKNGQAGEDGEPGQSGGNVLIMTDSIENSKALTIISCGGNGADGQSGGNGRDGAAGKDGADGFFDD